MTGFIPTSRAPLMMDVVATAILIVVPALTYALWLVTKRRDYAGHRRVQVALSLTLGLVILLFEAEVRTHDWLSEAEASPFFTTWLFPVFYAHLAVAVTATVTWTLTVVTALWRFPKPPRPGAFSRAHKRLGWLAAGTMYATAVTGWVFYYVAFLAH